jgi:hypothetical protein
VESRQQIKTLNDKYREDSYVSDEVQGKHESRLKHWRHRLCSPNPNDFRPDSITIYIIGKFKMVLALWLGPGGLPFRHHRHLHLFA